MVVTPHQPAKTFGSREKLEAFVHFNEPRACFSLIEPPKKAEKDERAQFSHRFDAPSAGAALLFFISSVFVVYR